ncbi:hypothetical protein ABPG74_010791 [Tetrahymena malaccensis]
MNTENQEQSQVQEKKYNSLKTIPQQGLLCKQYYKAQEECLVEKVYPVFKPLSLLILEIMLYILSGGLLFILFSWNNEWKFKIFYKLVNINQARQIVVYGPDKDVQIEKIMNIENKCVFQYRFQKFVYDEQSQMFLPFGDNIMDRNHKEIIQSAKNGLNDNQINSSVTRNGVNCTDIPDQGVFVLAFHEFFSPFFLFQVASCLLWYFDTYEIYATVIITTSTFSLLFKLYEERTNLNRIKKLSYFRGQTTVIRNGESKVISSNELSYGDVVILKEGETAPCDMVIVEGSVIVNESMLTGESVPIIKSALADIDCQFSENRQNIIYGGSQIMMVSNSKLVVIRIGFETLKGNLIRSILYPKQHNQISFQNDSIKFLSILLFVTMVQFFIALPTFIDNLERGTMETGDLVKKFFDLITISVPPALPTCLSFGVSFSLNRMRRKQIFCINNEKINICGIVKSVCFDKTGTLTEELLSFKLISSFSNNSNQFEDQFCEEAVKRSHQKLPAFSRIQRQIIASCHSIMVYNNEFIGDPLDIEMFKNSSYCLVDNEGSKSDNQADQNDKLFYQGYEVLQELICNNSLGSPIFILKRFQFDADVQRMSVIVAITKENQNYIYTKGSPESIQKICKQSTIPKDFSNKLQEFTNEGYRVLALAYSQLNEVDFEKDRCHYENNLTFGGFLVFENKLKPETTEHIKLLKNNDVQVRMVTGDNPETSLNIAKQCGILSLNQQINLLDFSNKQFTVNGKKSDLDQFMNSASFVQGQEQLVITGNFFEEFLQSKTNDNLQQQQSDIESNSCAKRSSLFFSLILQYGKVFARMKPDQKQSLIHLLQKYQDLQQGYSFIGMCGDGANDCQALKDADMGISLGEAEASVAAAFTSKVINISVIEYILREGRCCLTTSFQCFKYMALYSLIQGFTQTITYFRGTLPADMQILYWDLFIIIPLTFFLGLTEASDKLTPEIPAHRLFSYKNILSVVGQGVIQLLFLIITVATTCRQSWYLNPKELFEIQELGEEELVPTTYDTTVLFWVSNFQYIFTVIAFSIGSVHKKPFYTNLLFTFFLVSITGLSLLIIFSEQQPILDFFTVFTKGINQNDDIVTQMDYNWKYVILAIILANALVTILYEKYVLTFLINLIERKNNKAYLNVECTTVTQENLKQTSPK